MNAAVGPLDHTVLKKKIMELEEGCRCAVVVPISMTYVVDLPAGRVYASVVDDVLSNRLSRRIDEVF